jgi:hypothetical protein
MVSATVVVAAIQEPRAGQDTRTSARELTVSFLRA